MSKIEVNTVEPQCGTTLTLGGSGDTVTLGSGASQSGFGRSGSVDWQTSIKTSGFTAVSGEGYFCNTTGGAFTVTLPASPSAGDIVSIKDYANTFDSNNLTLGRNSSNIGGNAQDATIAQEGIAVTLVYADATKGWLVTESGLQTEAPTELFVAATGGTITTSGNFKIHTFTGPGTFTVSCAGNPSGSNTVDYLVVAGGGAGARGGGGGGAGGARFYASPDITSYPASPRNAPAALPVSVTAYPITVGAAGAAAGGCSAGGDGGTSTFSTISSAGGGGAGGQGPAAWDDGRAGGSGGGTGRDAGPTANAGAGNTPPVSPSQGEPGGGSPTTGYSGGGGGGALLNNGGNAIGGPPACVEAGGTGGAGGGFPTTFVASNGVPSSCEQYFSGGGGGGANGSRPDAASYGLGGLGGGGNGGIHSPHPQSRSAVAGTDNTGGGGGGSGTNAEAAANGGSGIVIIRYKFQ